MNLFYLAYHNRSDDKQILEDLARTLFNVKGVINNSFNKKRSIEELNKRKAMRIGIVSDFFNNHSII